MAPPDGTEVGATAGRSGRARVVLDEHRLMDDRRTRYALSAVAGSAMCISAIFEEGEMKRKSLAKGSCESGYV